MYGFEAIDFLEETVKEIETERCYLCGQNLIQNLKLKRIAFKKVYSIAVHLACFNYFV
jgi:hypothetical protein